MAKWWLTLLCVLAASPSESAVIDFTSPQFVHLATFASSGLVDWDPEWTWNGQPRSPDNEPSDAQLRLRASVKFYVDSAKTNQLLIQITDVVTTQGASWFDAAFDAVTQTGVRISSAFLSDQSPLFDDGFANVGQVLACCAFPEQVTPLTTTPGYRLDKLDSTVLINTIDQAERGFTSLSNIRGAERMRGGGVFGLTFGSDVNFLELAIWDSVIVSSEYGAGRQYITASRVDVVPEAPSFSLVVVAFLSVARRSWVVRVRKRAADHR